MRGLLAHQTSVSSAFRNSSSKRLSVTRSVGMSVFCHANLYPHGLKSLSPGVRTVLLMHTNTTQLRCVGRSVWTAA